MNLQALRERRRVLALPLSVAAIVAALVFVPAAFESGSSNGLRAYVTINHHGSLPACSDDGSDCGPANSVWFFVHVANRNALPAIDPQAPVPSRSTLRNAYVLTSLDESFTLNGVEVSHGTLVPPPNLTNRFGSAGRWISTVTCGQPVPLPCATVTRPGILPGEDAAAFFDGWIHEHVDGSGLLVGKFTLHGTLNGEAIDLVARSQSIRMLP